MTLLASYCLPNPPQLYIPSPTPVQHHSSSLLSSCLHFVFRLLRQVIPRNSSPVPGCAVMTWRRFCKCCRSPRMAPQRVMEPLNSWGLGQRVAQNNMENKQCWWISKCGEYRHDQCFLWCVFFLSLSFHHHLRAIGSKRVKVEMWMCFWWVMCVIVSVSQYGKKTWNRPHPRLQHTGLLR